MSYVSNEWNETFAGSISLMATKDISDRQVCEAYAAYAAYAEDRSRNSPERYLMQLTGQPEKVCWCVMERAHNRRLIEYGVSLRAGWLTEKGKQLLDNV